MNKKVGMLLQKRTDTRGVGISTGLSLARGSGSLTPRFRLGPPRTEPKGSSGPPRFCGAMRGDADRALIVYFSHVMNATVRPVRVVLQSSEIDVHARCSF